MPNIVKRIERPGTQRAEASICRECLHQMDGGGIVITEKHWTSARIRAADAQTPLACHKGVICNASRKTMKVAGRVAAGRYFELPLAAPCPGPGTFMVARKAFQRSSEPGLEALTRRSC
jgi:hypothetical protein